jgi:hypothetical protein
MPLILPFCVCKLQPQLSPQLDGYWMGVPTETAKSHQDSVTKNNREQVADYDIEALD